MVSTETTAEIEQFLGDVPSFMDGLAEPAFDHAWGILRDLQLGETELSTREKALVGLGAAASIGCPYCVHFHREEARLEGVTDEELKEATNVGGGVQYFSTVLHGSEMDLDTFRDETAAIVDHVSDQSAPADDD